jgi:hypothetical protein
MTVLQESIFTVQPLKTAPSWVAYLIPFTPDRNSQNPPQSGTRPVRQPVRRQEQHQSIAALLDAAAQALTANSHLQRELFVHSWKLHVGNTGALIQQNLRAWNPIHGIGIWPDRNPPSRWTQETFMDASAAMLQDEEPVLASYQVLHLRCEARIRSEVASSLFGGEALFQLFSRCEADAFFARTKSTYLPLITDTLFRHARFYVPLLEAKTVSGATDQQLATWLCGAEAYLRESAEDRGILILARTTHLRALQGAASHARIHLASPA